MYKHEGLTFRKIEETDLQCLQELKEESWFGTHSVSFLNKEAQKKWFLSLDTHPIHPSNLVLAVDEHFSFSNHITVGFFKVFNIHWVNRTADVGWDVRSKFRGHGYGSKIVRGGTALCFELLNLRRLNAEILVTNEPSRKCAEKAGFVLEGTKREAIEREGKLIDSQMWGLLKNL